MYDVRVEDEMTVNQAGLCTSTYTAVLVKTYSVFWGGPPPMTRDKDL